VGSGLLLGTALGVIIPEGIEALADAHPASEIPFSHVALALLCGFTLMLVIEQMFSPHSPPSSSTPVPLSNFEPSAPSELGFDAELGELEREQGMPRASRESTHAQPSTEIQALPLTLGLVIHSLADGFALGVSLFSTSNQSESLSAIVFLAIVLHKLPTSLAFTSSLLATSLPRPQCWKHLVVFSLATPIATIFTYVILSFFGGSQHPDWPGIALLLSGGTFLNVATSVAHHSGTHSSGETLSHKMHLYLTMLGIFTPFCLSSLFGHGH